MEYKYINVKSVSTKVKGKHGDVHIMPLPNQEPYLDTMYVECSKTLSNDYEVGTRFRIKAKIVHPEGKASFVYTHYNWDYEVLGD